MPGEDCQVSLLRRQDGGDRVTFNSEDEFISAFVAILKEESPDRADFNNWIMKHRKNTLFVIPVSLGVDDENNFTVKAGLLFPETELSQELHKALVKAIKTRGPELDKAINDIVAEAIISYGDRKKEVKDD